MLLKELTLYLMVYLVVIEFVSGDGSFNIKTTTVRTGKVQLRFAVNLHIREQEVIKGLANFFNLKSDKYIYYKRHLSLFKL